VAENDPRPTSVVQLMAQIVTTYVSHNPIALTELATLITVRPGDCTRR
jgi:predicted transcriptional regulator